MSIITELNDAFRKTGQDGMVFFTPGISCLPPEKQAEIMERVRHFDAFTEANDPYGEHDCGIFEFEGQTVFWKLDYYDLDMRYGSPNPADHAVTKRVLTVMLSREY